MRELAPVLVVLLLLLVIAAAVSVGVVWLFSGGGSSQQVATVLVYEVDPGSGMDSQSVDLREVVEVLSRRINPGWSQRARVSLRDDGRIEIGLFGEDPGLEQWLADRVETVGTLEFRVLANHADHASLIDRAMAQSAVSRLVTEPDGEVLGRWVPVPQGEEMPFRTDSEVVTRTVPREGRQVFEVLVVHDPFNVTGAYVQDAKAEVDPQNAPCISFVLTPEGGNLFSRLTSGNQPNFMSGMVRKLGIILNGQLRSAPAIQSVIQRHGMITGSFSKPEAERLADVLRGGPLPVPLRRVERRADEGSR
jgi:SecD/SecF fusion protein